MTDPTPASSSGSSSDSARTGAAAGTPASQANTNSPAPEPVPQDQLGERLAKAQAKLSAGGSTVGGSTSGTAASGSAVPNSGGSKLGTAGLSGTKPGASNATPTAPTASASPSLGVPGRGQGQGRGQGASARQERVLWAIVVLAFLILVAAIAWMILGRDTGLEGRVATLEQQVADLSNRPSATAPLAAEIQGLQRRLAALESRPVPAPVDVSGLDQQLNTLNQRMVALDNRLSRRTALDAAAAALAAGRPFGALLAPLHPLPAALARFEAAAPPTADGLRASFEKAAPAALNAARPAESGSWWQVTLERLGHLVTIRRDGAVVWGNPAEAALAAMRKALVQDDLAGAVAAAANLPQPAAQVMAPWVDQAGALLAARAALTNLQAG